MSYRPLQGDVAAEVRAELARQRWSVQKLSDATGIPLATLRRRITGASPFNLAEIDLITAALGVAPLHFFTALGASA